MFTLIKKLFTKQTEQPVNIKKNKVNSHLYIEKIFTLRDMLEHRNINNNRIFLESLIEVRFTSFENMLYNDRRDVSDQPILITCRDYFMNNTSIVFILRCIEESFQRIELNNLQLYDIDAIIEVLEFITSEE